MQSHQHVYYLESHQTWMVFCQQGITCDIENGNHINFWMKPWLCPNLIVRNLIEGPLPQHEDTTTLALYISNSSINLTNLPFELPSTVSNLLNNYYIPTLKNKISYDHIYCGLTTSGHVIVKSLYNKLHHTNINNSF